MPDHAHCPFDGTQLDKDESKSTREQVTYSSCAFCDNVWIAQLMKDDMIVFVAGGTPLLET